MRLRGEGRRRGDGSGEIIKGQQDHRRAAAVEVSKSRPCVVRGLVGTANIRVAWRLIEEDGLCDGIDSGVCAASSARFAIRRGTRLPCDAPLEKPTRLRGDVVAFMDRRRSQAGGLPAM